MFTKETAPQALEPLCQSGLRRDMGIGDFNKSPWWLFSSGKLGEQVFDNVAMVLSPGCKLESSGEH